MLKYSLNQYEKRFTDYIVNLAIENPQKKVFTITLNEIIDIIKVDAKAQSEIKIILKKLMSKLIIIKMDGKIQITHWFKSISFYDNTIEVVIDENIFPMIIQEKSMKTYQFKSQYALYLYLFFEEQNFQEKIVVDIEQLYTIMNVQEKEIYKQYFGNFRKIVLNMAINEINKKLPFYVTMDTMNTGRKITHIIFNINQGRILL